MLHHTAVEIGLLELLGFSKGSRLFWVQVLVETSAYGKQDAAHKASMKYAKKLRLFRGLRTFLYTRDMYPITTQDHPKPLLTP